MLYFLKCFSLSNASSFEYIDIQVTVKLVVSQKGTPTSVLVCGKVLCSGILYTNIHNPLVNFLGVLEPHILSTLTIEEAFYTAIHVALRIALSCLLSLIP